MSKMVLHVDGSVCRAIDGARRSSVGWAVVAHFSGTYLEHHGALERELNGYHELIALVEGVLLAHARGFEPCNVSIYTDDNVLGYAPWYLHPGNFKQSVAEALSAKLRFLTRLVYSDDVHELVLRYLRDAHLNWVKGHNFCVDQERADYLARHAAWSILGRPQAPLLDVGRWLQAGIGYYEDSETPRTWHAPFTDVGRELN